MHVGGLAGLEGRTDVGLQADQLSLSRQSTRASARRQLRQQAAPGSAAPATAASSTMKASRSAG